LDRDAQEYLHGEYRKIMAIDFESLEDLWNAFNKIEKGFFEKFNTPTAGDVYYKFEKEKLRGMASRVIKHITSQNSLRIQAKNTELERLEEISVIPLKKQ
jgi:hypothetical protein